MTSDASNTQLITEALHVLSQAWRRLQLYPEGHPERANVSERAVEALRNALGDEDELALGVTRQGFVVAEQMHSDLGARELANLLYRHNVALVRVRADLDSESFEQFLESLRFPSGGHQAPALDASRPTLQWTGIRMENADYSALLATEDTETTAAPHRLTLWERLLQLQLRRGAASPFGQTGAQGDTQQLQNTLKRIFSSLPREMLGSEFTGDYPQQVQQIVELLEVAVIEHVREAVEQRRLIDLQDVDELLRELPSGIAVAALERVLDELGHDDQDRLRLGALLAAVDARLALLAARRLRDRSYRFGGSALAAVRDLSERVDEESASAADSGDGTSAILDSLLAEGRDAVRLPPEDAFVFRFGRCRDVDQQWPETLEPMRATLQPGSVQLALLNALCEMLGQPQLHQRSAAHLVPRLEELLGDLLETGHPMAAVALIHSLRDLRAAHQDRLAEPLDELLHRLRGESFAKRIGRMLVTADERRHAQLQTLVGALGEPLIQSLVNQLAEEDDRARRRILFDFLKTFPSEVIPAARNALSDSRWYVVRNMVALLDEIDDRGAVPYLRRAALHQDLRVRTAAIRALARIDRHVPEELVRELLDEPDTGWVERTMLLLGRTRLSAAVAPLCEIVAQRAAGKRGKTLRVRAIEALGLIGDVRALEVVRPLLGALRMASQEERRAVYRSLGGYPPSSVRDLVSKGLTARDAQIRSVCEQLARGEALQPDQESSDD